MLLLSNTSRAPSPLASSAPMARLSRYSRSLAMSTRCSKSTFIRPGAGVTGRAGTGGMGATIGRSSRGTGRAMYSTIKRMYSVAVKRAKRGYMAGSFDPGAELGPRLRQVREQRGLSARELARRIQCSPSLISQIERGLSAPSVGMLYALATELRTSLDFLFGAPAPGDGAPGGVTVTAHGDGRVHMKGEGEAGGGRASTGHGIVQRAGTRRTIDLASGVRWERLTPGPDERV